MLLPYTVKILSLTRSPSCIPPMSLPDPLPQSIGLPLFLSTSSTFVAFSPADNNAVRCCSISRRSSSSLQELIFSTCCTQHHSIPHIRHRHPLHLCPILSEQCRQIFRLQRHYFSRVFLLFASKKIGVPNTA